MQLVNQRRSQILTNGGYAAAQAHVEAARRGGRLRQRPLMSPVTKWKACFRSGTAP